MYTDAHTYFVVEPPKCTNLCHLSGFEPRTPHSEILIHKWTNKNVSEENTAIFHEFAQSNSLEKQAWLFIYYKLYYEIPL